MSANLDRLVKLAEEAIANDGDQWQFADALLEEIPDERASRPARSSANDGSFALLQELAERIERELGVRKKQSTLRNIRATARAWPSETRHADVSFEVHAILRGKPGQLKAYKKRAAADHKRSPGFIISPRLTKERVRAYRNDDKPMVPWTAAMAKKINRVVHQAASPEALDELERLFNEAIKEQRKHVGDYGRGY